MNSIESNIIFSPKANLADPRLGAKVIYATDDFFAEKERLINVAAPVFIAEKYDENGKWMDGWESRRKRSAGYDYCIVKLPCAATIESIDIDTAHFTGNFPPAASIDACNINADPSALRISDEEINNDKSIEWFEIVPSLPLNGDSLHTVNIEQNAKIVTHLRLNIYPDGGIARLRVYGQFYCDWQKKSELQINTHNSIDLLSILNGSRAIACNDEHYGNIKNLTLPGRGINMGDGWETRRRREPGNDWIIFQLGHAGIIDSVEVDTAHFKGNFPEKCSIQAAFVKNGTDASLVPQSLFWEELLPSQNLTMDAIHRFSEELKSMGKISHIRFNIFPDGGISRLRLFGKI